MPDPTDILADWKAKTDAAGEGWFEWFKMPENTSHIAYVHESGKVYDPENGWNPTEFTLAAAEGHVHKLMRVDEAAPLLAAVEAIRALHRLSTGGHICHDCEYTWPCPTIRALDAALSGSEPDEGSER